MILLCDSHYWLLVCHMITLATTYFFLPPEEVTTKVMIDKQATHNGCNILVSEKLTFSFVCIKTENETSLTFEEKRLFLLSNTTKFDNFRGFTPHYSEAVGT